MPIVSCAFQSESGVCRLLLGHGVWVRCAAKFLRAAPRAVFVITAIRFQSLTPAHHQGGNFLGCSCRVSLGSPSAFYSGEL